MAVFSAPQLSFNAVTPPSSPGETGTIIDLGIIQSGFLLYLVTGGTSSDSGYAGFDGSLDGTSWYSLTGGESLVRGGLPPSVQISGVPARYVRANAYTASGSLVLTASVAGVEL